MKSTHKVLLITDTSNPAGGGAEKVFFSLKHALQNYPELSVTSLSFAPEEKIDNDSILLKETPNAFWRLFWRLFFNPWQYWRIRRAIKQINPDVIHLHNVKKYTVSLLKAVRGFRVIQTVHDFSLICPTSWNLHKNLQPCAHGLTSECVWQHQRDLPLPLYLGVLMAFLRMRSLLKKSVTHFIAPSPFLQDYLQKNHFQPCDYLPPLRDEKSQLDFSKMRAKHFLYIGQLGKHKGVSTLINEFARAVRVDKELTLSLAGAGKEEKNLRQQVKKLGLEKNIFFLGWTPAAELYASATAVIFPSIGLESFGLVLTEAMQHARAVIGSNRGPTTWLVDDKETGLLFDPVQEGDLAEKILLLAGNLNLAEQYGRNAYKKMQNFMSNDEVLKRTVKLYKM